jgi:hypothetical protein
MVPRGIARCRRAHLSRSVSVGALTGPSPDVENATSKGVLWLTKGHRARPKAEGEKKARRGPARGGSDLTKVVALRQICLAVPIAAASAVRGSPEVAGSIEFVERYRTSYWAPSGSKMREQEMYLRAAPTAADLSPMASVVPCSQLVRDSRISLEPFIMRAFGTTRARPPAIMTAPFALTDLPSGSRLDSMR